LTARKTTTKPNPKTPAKPRKHAKKAFAPPKRTGRPSMLTKELADYICGELSAGKSLSSICRIEGMPHQDTVWRWIRESKEFRDQYDRAKEESADALVDEMLSIADDGRNDYMEQFDADGISIGWKLNGEHVQRSRLRLDVRKWAASKLKPKRYGDRLDMNHGVQPDDPLAALIKSVQGASFGPVNIKDDEDDNSKEG
jgi:hypothetical protein